MYICRERRRERGAIFVHLCTEKREREREEEEKEEAEVFYSTSDQIICVESRKDKMSMNNEDEVNGENE